MISWWFVIEKHGLSGNVCFQAFGFPFLECTILKSVDQERRSGNTILSNE